MDVATGEQWLEACREAAKRMKAMLGEHATTAQRAVEVGRGIGGDRTLVIDERAEDIVFEVLAGLREGGLSFTVISEERGEVDFGAALPRVVVDPIDGSLNAKRGIPHHSLSIAVAEGQTIGDVTFGFVHDFGPDEEWTAVAGAGALLDGERLDATLGERRGGDGRLEVLGIESADPRWVAQCGEGLATVAYRLRAVGSIAITMCQVAAARFDAMASLRACRSVDAAAAALIVREAGGEVCFPGAAEPLAAPLDLLPHHPVVAAREPGTLLDIAAIVG